MSSEVFYPSDPPFGPVLNGTQVVVFYHYRPNKPAAFAFLALFGVATLGHLIYLFRLRAWHFIPLVLGGIAETFGYCGRAQSSSEPSKVGPWILQNFLLLSSAPLIAATIYMTLGRLITALSAQRHSLVTPRWLAKIYVLIDVACLATQIAGSVLPASGDAAVVALSKTLILGGLIAQVVALCLFIFMARHARRRIARGKEVGGDGVVVDPSLNWQNHFRALEVVTALVAVRSIVRMAEYAQGEAGFVIKHEVFIYVFDAAPMFLAVGVYLVLHPSRLIRDASGGKGHVSLSDGHVELGSG